MLTCYLLALLPVCADGVPAWQGRSAIYCSCPTSRCWSKACAWLAPVQAVCECTLRGLICAMGAGRSWTFTKAKLWESYPAVQLNAWKVRPSCSEVAGSGSDSHSS